MDDEPIKIHKNSGTYSIETKKNPLVKCSSNLNLPLNEVPQRLEKEQSNDQSDDQVMLAESQERYQT